MDVKSQVLEQIMDMMDDRILSKLKKPGMPDEEKSIEIEKVKVGEGEEGMSELAEGQLEPDMDVDPEILKQLMSMHEED